MGKNKLEDLGTALKFARLFEPLDLKGQSPL